MSMFTEIVMPATIASMIEDRDRAIAAMSNLYRSVELAREAAIMIDRYAMPYAVSPRIPLDDAKKEIDRTCWQKSFRIGGFDRIWDSVAKTEFENSLKILVPEFTDANLRATLLEYIPQQEMMFQRGAVTLLRRLSYSYKSNTNSAFKLGSRSVVNAWAEMSWSKSSRSQVRHQKQEQVADLLRIIAVLSGVSFEAGEAVAAVNAAWHNDEDYEAYGLRLVPHKNGNVHVYMSPQLLDRVNALIADFYGDFALGDASDKR